MSLFIGHALEILCLCFIYLYKCRDCSIHWVIMYEWPSSTSAPALYLVASGTVKCPWCPCHGQHFPMLLYLLISRVYNSIVYKLLYTLVDMLWYKDRKHTMNMVLQYNVMCASVWSDIQSRLWITEKQEHVEAIHSPWQQRKIWLSWRLFHYTLIQYAARYQLLHHQLVQCYLLDIGIWVDAIVLFWLLMHWNVGIVEVRDFDKSIKIMHWRIFPPTIFLWPV